MAMHCVSGSRECDGCMKCYEGAHIGNCENCSDPILAGEDHYNIDGVILHEDCLWDWAEQFMVRG